MIYLRQKHTIQQSDLPATLPNTNIHVNSLTNYNVNSTPHVELLKRDSPPHVIRKL